MNLQKYLFTSSVITIIAVLFVLLIAAGCAVILEKQINLKKQSQSDAISSVDTVDTSTDSTALTAGWQTYRNEQYGFEVMYPPSLFFSLAQEKGSFFFTEKSSEDDGVVIFVISNQKNLPFDRWCADTSLDKSLSKDDQYEKQIICSCFIIDINQGQECTKSSVANIEVYEIPTGLAPFVSLVFSAHNLIFEVRYDIFYDTVKSMISTFKFIEPSYTIDTSTWKTYRNEQYGFEVKYPPSFSNSGQTSENSVLGEGSTKVPGVRLGPIILIPLTNYDLKQKGQQFIADLKSSSQISPNPTTNGFSCKTEIIDNSAVQSNLVRCSMGVYGLIESGQNSIFIDYYFTQPEFVNVSIDMNQILSTFKLVGP